MFGNSDKVVQPPLEDPVQEEAGSNNGKDSSSDDESSGGHSPPRTYPLSSSQQIEIKSPGRVSFDSSESPQNKRRMSRPFYPPTPSKRSASMPAGSPELTDSPSFSADSSKRQNSSFIGFSPNQSPTSSGSITIYAPRGLSGSDFNSGVESATGFDFSGPPGATDSSSTSNSSGFDFGNSLDDSTVFGGSSDGFGGGFGGGSDVFGGTSSAFGGTSGGFGGTSGGFGGNTSGGFGSFGGSFGGGTGGFGDSSGGFGDWGGFSFGSSGFNTPFGGNTSGGFGSFNSGSGGFGSFSGATGGGFGDNSGGFGDSWTSFSFGGPSFDSSSSTPLLGKPKETHWEPTVISEASGKRGELYSISAMRQYGNYSFEELRFRDNKQPSTPREDDSTNIDQLQSDLKSMLDNEYSFPDVTFVVDDQKIYAHRAILAARCEKFRAMFSSGMQESNTVGKSIEMNDADYDSFKSMLYFIYTGATPAIDTYSKAIRLLELAEEYLLSDLKSICEDAICLFVCSDTVITFLELSHCYHALTLRRTCEYFILKHFAETSQREEFKRLKKPVLSGILGTACELLTQNNVNIPFSSLPTSIASFTNNMEYQTEDDQDCGYGDSEKGDSIRLFDPKKKSKKKSSFFFGKKGTTNNLLDEDDGKVPPPPAPPILPTLVDSFTPSRTPLRVRPPKCVSSDGLFIATNSTPVAVLPTAPSMSSLERQTDTPSTATHRRSFSFGSSNPLGSTSFSSPSRKKARDEDGDGEESAKDVDLQEVQSLVASWNFQKKPEDKKSLTS